jgi:hypothetical protein
VLSVIMLNVEAPLMMKKKFCNFSHRNLSAHPESLLALMEPGKNFLD